MADAGGTTRREVWVFGAGITGLTAAHELAERGFQVTVIEKDPDVRFFGEPAVGGMAKTQWAIPSEGDTGISPTRPVLPVVRVNFKPNTDIPQANIARLDRFIEDLAKTYKAPFPPLLVRGYRRLNEAHDLAEKRAAALASALSARLAAWNEGKEREKQIEVDIDTRRGADPFESQQEPCAEIEAATVPVPGEHGFRYFPAFYWHVFDTMRRIRLTDDRERSSPRRFQSVLENLVSTDRVTLAARRSRSGPDVREARAGRSGKSLVLSRRAPRSLREAFDLLRSVLQDLGHEPSDIAHLALKLTRFLTSGPSRRGTYEAMTFAEFIEKDKLSKVCQGDLENAPEVLGGMRASEADARTQGNIALQLLLGDLRETGVVDATLNGPTSSVWFLPWRDYLARAHSVRFRRGTLKGFQPAPEQKPTRVVPDVTWHGQLARPAPPADTLFVLALDLPAYLPDPSGDDDTRQSLCDAFSKAQSGLSLEKGFHVRAGDFRALDRWIKASSWDWNGEEQRSAESGPMRHLVGLQLFFETNQRPTSGHTIFLDAPWRLSSIAQPAFWSAPRTSPGRPLGLISVDIGEWYTPDRGGRCAWRSTLGEIQASVWDQMAETFKSSAAKPDYFHLDHGITLGADGRPVRNRTPYLITRPVDWPLRPGEPEKYLVAGTWTDDGRLAAGGYVLAGTFMKTYTRLTTMESANESARHAVNALLDAIGSDTPRCEVRNVEDDEPPDLRTLKELDEKLFLEGMPHMMDTLRADDWVGALLRRSDASVKSERTP